ncbi:hypothetical protein SAMN05446935_7511 [Burkholderia sp. YR290]|nr:hypothetical protein SAMN05446935_7511 [Burkholderia sp. YR290]
MTPDEQRHAVSRLAHQLATGYYAFVVAQYVAVNPLSINALPPTRVPGQNPTGQLPRKNGTFHTIDLRHYLDLLREDFDLQGHVLRAWATGALMTLGDALDKDQRGYFDRAPVLELVYHLRNGVAHGNHFTITASGKKRLANYPAHNRGAAVQSPGAVFEITPDIDGPVLFDFLGPADVIDLLQSVEIHLSNAAPATHPK